MNELLDELDDLEKEATSGEWDSTASGYVTSGDETVADAYPGDADFIAALRNAYPAMSAELRRLEADNVRWQEAIGRASQKIEDMHLEAESLQARCERYRDELRGIENTPPKDLWNGACPQLIAWYQKLVRDMQGQARRALEEGEK